MKYEKKSLFYTCGHSDTLRYKCVHGLYRLNVDNNGGEAVPMDPGKGYKTWGCRSGGGACSIAQYVTPDGMIYQISSSRSHTTYKNHESIDSGTPVDIELTNEQMYDIEYLNKQF